MIFLLGWLILGVLGLFCEAHYSGQLSLKDTFLILLTGPLLIVFLLVEKSGDIILWKKK